MSEVKPIYFHDCPALGKDAKVIRAIWGNKDGSEMYGWRYKCPFCSYTVGELEPMETYDGEIEVYESNEPIAPKSNVGDK